ncbi:hypothetical protein SAMN06313486_10820 [Epsilonproteobacteria bacterium SCGC AD-308-P11]|jgi:uncharacterized membrane protein|nr:hypothetical protein SAMN06313486_10820 [Epsilonproteobacteria bacterium SCGC AD-308-P11]
MHNNKEDQRTDAAQSKLKMLNLHSMLASFIVIVGALLVFLSEDTEKNVGIYIVIFGIAYSFITRIRIWRNNK